MNKTMCSKGMIVIKKLDQLWMTLILFSFLCVLFCFLFCLFVFVKKKRKIKITIKTGNSFQEI